MPRIQIGTQLIELPASGADPNWAQGIIDAFEAIAEQLQTVASPFDVPPKVQILTSDGNVNLNIQDCVFPAGSVRSFTMYYAIYRTNDSISVIEQGEVAGKYDTLNATWSITDSFSGTRQANGLPYQSFGMSGDQLQLSTVSIGGAYNVNTSTISYSAKTQLATE